MYAWYYMHIAKRYERKVWDMYRSLVNGMIETDEQYEGRLKREARELFQNAEDPEDWESFEEYFEVFKRNNIDQEFEYFEKEPGDCNFSE